MDLEGSYETLLPENSHKSRCSGTTASRAGKVAIVVAICGVIAIANLVLVSDSSAKPEAGGETSSLVKSSMNEDIFDSFDALSAEFDNQMKWELLGDGPYGKREGLMGVSYKGAMYISAGRGTFGVGFSAEVWRSEDGASWTRVANNIFPRRSYHNMVVAGDCMVIFGGQTLLTFYNDVWESCDGEGKVWNKIADAPWPARAGASATVASDGTIVMAGGCYNKDNNPAKRSFWGDVWISKDGGRTWREQTGANGAEWIARSGPRLVEFKNALYLVAGEIGFTPDTQLKDVWKSEDLGESWTLVTDEPGYSERSGHGVIVSPDGESMVLLAGWPKLHDMYVTRDGAEWTKVTDSVWNCNSPDCGRFDFWTIVHNNDIYVMGGCHSDSTFGQLYAETWKLTKA